MKTSDWIKTRSRNEQKVFDVLRENDWMRTTHIAEIVKLTVNQTSHCLQKLGDAGALDRQYMGRDPAYKKRTEIGPPAPRLKVFGAGKKRRKAAQNNNNEKSVTDQILDHLATIDEHVNLIQQKLEKLQSVEKVLAEYKNI